MWFVVVGIVIAAGTIFFIVRSRLRAASRQYIDVGVVSERWIAEQRAIAAEAAREQCGRDT